MSRGKTKPNGDNPAMKEDDVGSNKMEAVRRALGALGHDAKPTALHDHILSKYNMDIEANMISSYKSTILRGNGISKSRSHKGPGMDGADATAGISLRDLKLVKELTSRLGATRLRELIELLA